jgi:hypothetical protein
VVAENSVDGTIPTVIEVPVVVEERAETRGKSSAKITLCYAISALDSPLVCFGSQFSLMMRQALVLLARSDLNQT